MWQAQKSEWHALSSCSENQTRCIPPKKLFFILCILCVPSVHNGIKRVSKNLCLWIERVSQPLLLRL